MDLALDPDVRAYAILEFERGDVSFDTIAAILQSLKRIRDRKEKALQKWQEEQSRSNKQNVRRRK